MFLQYSVLCGIRVENHVTYPRCVTHPSLGKIVEIGGEILLEGDHERREAL